MAERLLVTTNSLPPVTVSFYFASNDQAFCEMLNSHLSSLRRSSRIATWDERQILHGSNRNQELDQHLTTDHILVLLISSDFMNSDECCRHMQTALQRHRSWEAKVIRRRARPFLWQDTELATRLPRGQKPLDSQSEEALVEVVNGISQLVNLIQPWVFVICAPEDEDFVARLQRDLAHSNVQLFPGYGQITETRDLMRSTPVVFLIASPTTTASSRVEEQIEVAAKFARPVLIIWADGEDHQEPYVERWQAEAVFDMRAERYETAQAALVAHLKQQREGVAAPPQEMFSLRELENPYKGLDPFTEKDAHYFFGREALIDELTGVVKQILDEDSKGKHSARLLTVLLGASGSGKSSVVRAGLLPLLRRGGVANSRDWIYLEPMVPGPYPLERLADSLAQQPVLGGDNRALARELRSDSHRTLHQMATRLVGSSARRAVLFIDQFEEVFTSNVSKEEQQQFFRLLLTAVNEPHGPLLVLLTLRADFYDRLMEYPDLYSVLEAHLVAVLPMGREDARNVIEGPARKVGVQFEKDLVGDLLFDVRDQAASLPLLQFTLYKLFELRKGRLITREAYDKIGGVKGALLQHAEETYKDLPSDEHRELAQIVFVRLVNAGQSSQDMTRRRVPLSDFDQVDPERTRLLTETIEAFVKARLLTKDVVADTITIEVSHESLIREWPRCMAWVQEAREDFPFQQDLRTKAAEWEQLSHPKELLYRGDQLRTVKKKIASISPNSREIRFLRASEVNQRLLQLRMVVLLLVPMIVVGSILGPILALRPAWCPNWLCPVAQLRVPNIGVHDDNLQVTFQTLQSSYHLITVDPSTYTLGTPDGSDAQLLNTSQVQPYRVVVKIHSLQQGRFGLTIEQMSLLVTGQSQTVPYPLRVRFENPQYVYTNNLYRVTYRGQPVGVPLPAVYAIQPLAHVSLSPGETDELTLEVRSVVVADLHFKLQVTYQVITDTVSHTLTLPNTFEVIFSDPKNWHMYQRGPDGRLVALP